jgi:hypothetical protein
MRPIVQTYRHRKQRDRRGRWLHLLPFVLLLLVLGGLAVKDALTGAPLRQEVAVRDEPPEEHKSPDAPAVPLKVDIHDEPEERAAKALLPIQVSVKDEPEEGGAQPDPVSVVQVDPTPLVDYTYDAKTMRVGITALRVPNRDGTFAAKQITYRADGSTNNTRLMVDGKEEDLSPPHGSWLVRQQILPDDPQGAWLKRTKSLFQRFNIEVIQVVEIVPSKQPVEVAPRVRKRQLDTVLVRYVIHNKDRGPHRVGLRVMVDTLIGDNDGVPFTIPGLPGMIDTYANFDDAGRAGQSIPDFIQALEVPDLQYPGTVAHMTLRVGGRIEPPNRVSLTHWPSSSCPWDVPLELIKDDSAVAIYWNERLLEPGERREVGYAYGLGGVTSTEGDGKLGITLGGTYEPFFTVTTYVTDPGAGQTLSLELPAGLEVQGDARVRVPPGTGTPATSIVTWKVKVLQTGEFRLRVASSTGMSQSKMITIARPSEGHFVLALDGLFAPGQTFAVRATVTDPVPGQTLTLRLPHGLEQVGGQAEEQVSPPAGDPKNATSVVGWEVKVREAGRHSLRVQSNTGLAQTKTITIDREPGRFVLELHGDIAPGKDFTVLARVTNPLPDQRLMLHLPEKLLLKEGDATQAVPPLLPGVSEGVSTVSWRVRVLDHGRLPVRVQSTTGVTRTKTITLTRPSAGQIFGK